MPKPLVTTINWTNPITRGLIFNIPFYEGGSTPKEIISNIVLALTGSAWVKNIFGNCINFTGASDKITFTVPASIATAVQNQMTFSCWVFRSTNDATTRRIVDPNGSASQGFILQTPNGDFNFSINFSTTGANATIAGAIASGVWTNLVATWSANDNIPLVYKNGVLTAPTSSTSKSGSQTDWTGITAFIGNKVSNDRVFNGIIDQFMIWNRVLSPLEIKQLYSNPWQIYNQPQFTRVLSTTSAAVAAAFTNFKTLLGVGNI